MERSANIAAKEGDVISSAEETLQLDDENLRGEKIKQYLVSIIKYQRRRKCYWYPTKYKLLYPCQCSCKYSYQSNPWLNAVVSNLNCSVLICFIVEVIEI